MTPDIHAATVLLQTEPELADALARIATAETVIAVGVTILIVLGIMTTVMVGWTLRQVIRVLRTIRTEFAPRTEPLLEQATRLAENANGIVDSVREEADNLRDTVEELNRRVRGAADAAEQRVRKLGAVLDVVQEEAESLLIEAAATARGANAAARALRGELDEDEGGAEPAAREETDTAERQAS